MAILKIARLGNPVLLRRAAPVTDPLAPEIRRLVTDMIETLAEGGGVGLAAPQVHESLRCFIYRVPESRASGVPDDEAQPFSVVINPEIVETSPVMVDGWEGCLSIPGMSVRVRRSTRILIRGQDVSGTWFTRQAAGFHARVIQHEFDHLEGLLTIGRLTDWRLIGFNEEIARDRPCIEALAAAVDEEGNVA